MAVNPFATAARIKLLTSTEVEFPVASRPLVSVITPCHNCEEFVAESVESVLQQTYPYVEMIVVDDGSTDRSAEILQRYEPRIRVIRVEKQKNSGWPAARNIGIQACAGSLLAFLDADDYWDREFIAKMVLAMESNNAGIAYCGWQNVGLSGGRGRPFIPADFGTGVEKLENLVKGPRWPMHAVLVRRELVEGVQGFQEEWTSCADFAMWIEIATRTPLVRVPEVMAFYRHHGGVQITKNRERIARNHLAVQQQFFARHPEIMREIGREKAREIMRRELLKRGYACYWDRDLPAARAIFRLALRHRYLAAEDLRYALPCLLPIALQRAVIDRVDQRESAGG